MGIPGIGMAEVVRGRGNDKVHAARGKGGKDRGRIAADDPVLVPVEAYRFPGYYPRLRGFCALPDLFFCRFICTVSNVS
jgi:hypothetical protein